MIKNGVKGVFFGENQVLLSKVLEDLILKKRLREEGRSRKDEGKR